MYLSQGEVAQRTSFLTSFLDKDCQAIKILDGAKFAELKTLFKVLASVVLAKKDSPQKVKDYFHSCDEKEALLKVLSEESEADSFLENSGQEKLRDFLISVHSCLPHALSVYFEQEG